MWKLAAAVMVGVVGVVHGQGSDVPFDSPSEHGRAMANGRNAAELSRELRNTVERADLGRFWGAALVIRNGEVLLAEGFGFANDELKAIDRESLFDMGSVSKMFTAAAVLRLEEDGKLSIQDPLSKFFPGAGKGADKVALKHLLNHTSGKSDRFGAIQHLAFEDRDEAVAKFVASRGSPGQRFQYCNGGYVVLAAVIEKVTGETYEKAVRRLVLEPAGMKGSGFLDGEGLDASKQTARGITGPQGEPRRGLMLDKKIEPWAWGLRGAGGLVTSVKDLIAWERAIRTGAVLGEAAAAKWVTPDKESYACGWMVSKDDEGRVVHQHGGATRGYRCQVLRYPVEQVFIAVMTGEADFSPEEMSRKLAAVLMPVIPSNTSVELKVDAAQLNQFKGFIAEKCEVKAERERRGGGAIVMIESVEPAAGRIATFTLDAGAVKRVVTLIRANLEASGRKAAEGGCKAGVYLYQYPEAGRSGELSLANVTWSGTPSYTGIDEDGRQFSDARIVLRVHDPEMNNGWPVMIHLDNESAKRLVGELEGK